MYLPFFHMAASSRAEVRAMARRAGARPVETDESAPILDLDFKMLACERTTLVVYMGLATLPQLAAGLIEAGLPPNTPAVAVQEGTSAHQRVERAPLWQLPEVVAAAQLRSPTLILIGKVVSLLTDARVAQSVAEAKARGDGTAIYQFLTDGPSAVDPLRQAALRRGAIVTPHNVKSP
mmetsp:Transcript_12160/g.28375  ORF Transcript_12160/g.28375 Transcript_12160/m.28375 type:complete len:178 (-) Transcript_12160:87-620(-)